MGRLCSCTRCTGRPRATPASARQLHGMPTHDLLRPRRDSSPPRGRSRRWHGTAGDRTCDAVPLEDPRSLPSPGFGANCAPTTTVQRLGRRVPARDPIARRSPDVLVAGRPNGSTRRAGPERCAASKPSVSPPNGPKRSLRHGKPRQPKMAATAMGAGCRTAGTGCRAGASLPFRVGLSDPIVYNDQ